MPVTIRPAAPQVGTGRARAASEDGPTVYVAAASAQWGAQALVVKPASEPMAASEPAAEPEPPQKRARPPKRSEAPKP